MTASPIVPTVDLMADGVQHGFLRLPWSRDDSAWGNLMIPITVIRNGAGPTALLTGGSHGDEYEGPVALVELARTLDPAQVSGAVVIVPFLNYPAFRAGRRLSPVDGANMNRIFPGKADGTLTQKIADYWAISEEGLNALPEGKFQDIRNTGALAAVYAHMVSLMNWQRVIQRTMRRLQTQPQGAVN